MANLYQLTDDFLTVFSMLEDEETPEQAILDTLESLTYEIEEKADGYAKIIKTLENNASGLKTEIERLTARKQIFENRAKFLKTTLETSMRAIGKMKFTTRLFSFNIQKNGGLRKLTIDAELEKIPKEFKVVQPDTVNNEKVREFLKAGSMDTCEFAHLEPQGESLRIK